jgi:RNA polymerase sigma factor (sigma-70 family)
MSQAASLCCHAFAHDDDPDDVLVDHVREGCEDSLALLYARYAPRCLGLAQKIVCDRQHAEDVLQEVFVAFWKHPERYHSDRGCISTWLLTITHRRSVDVLRRERRHVWASGGDVFDVIPAVDPSIDEQIIATIDSERVRAALMSLRENSRRILVLAYFGGFSQVEIAALTDAPLGTVKSRTRLAMVALRKALDDDSVSPTVVPTQKNASRLSV